MTHATTDEGRQCKTSNPPTLDYDGEPYTIGDRVELHPGTDLWMCGARYGEVIGGSLTPKDRVRVRLDKLPKRVFAGPEDLFRRVS